MIQLKTIIVEDVIDNLEAMKAMLNSYCPKIKLIGEATNIEEAFDLIIRKKPDLLILDIQIKGDTSFDLLKRLYQVDYKQFDLIFVTAYGSYDYATKAIDYAALKFITKPIDPEELKKAVEKSVMRFTQKQEARQQIGLLLQNLQGDNPIGLPLLQGKIEVVRLNEIAYIEADGSMSFVFLNNGKKLHTTRLLGDYKKMFPSEKFFQIEKGLVVNLDQVQRCLNRDGKLSLQLKDKEQTVLTASRKYGKELRNFLNSTDSPYADLKETFIAETLRKLLGRD